MLGDIKLTKEWEIVREDWHGNTFRYQRGLSEAEAKRIAADKNNPIGKDHIHKQTYEARPYLRDDPDITE